MKLAFFIMHLALLATPLGQGVSVYLHASFSPALSPSESLATSPPYAHLSPLTPLGTKGSAHQVLWQTR